MTQFEQPEMPSDTAFTQKEGKGNERTVTDFQINAELGVDADTPVSELEIVKFTVSYRGDELTRPGYEGTRDIRELYLARRKGDDESTESAKKMLYLQTQNNTEYAVLKGYPLVSHGSLKGVFVNAEVQDVPVISRKEFLEAWRQGEAVQDDKTRIRLYGMLLGSHAGMSKIEELDERYPLRRVVFELDETGLEGKPLTLALTLIARHGSDEPFAMLGESNRRGVMVRRTIDTETFKEVLRELDPPYEDVHFVDICMLEGGLFSEAIRSLSE